MATPPQVPTAIKILLGHADITPAVATQLTSTLANRQGFLVSNADAAINFRVAGPEVAAGVGGIIFPKTTVWVAAGPDCQVWVCPESGAPKMGYAEGA